ncbi:MAG: NAD(P)-dependent oxidoreductase, partial [Candidatus Omnitrophica bacterium]|nr:NAD(P)-dependent oxidoreductase [Candidatus Omnitrophota bacterium]
MKVIVFGGAGFVGSHVADALSEEGYNVAIFDKQTSAYLRADQDMILGDILDPESVKAAVSGCDYVYNFAGIADLDDATTRPADTVTQNIMGTVNILEACRQCKIRRLVYASTVYVYSERGGFYRCSKQAAELYIEEYQRKYGLEYTILRYGTVYGPRADESNSVHRYLKQALTNQKIICAGSGEEMREYIYICDAAKLSVQILHNKRHVNTHIIITGHHPMRFMDFLKMIKEILGDNVEIKLTEPDVASAHYNMTP